MNLSVLAMIDVGSSYLGLGLSEHQSFYTAATKLVSHNSTTSELGIIVLGWMDPRAKGNYHVPDPQ